MGESTELKDRRDTAGVKEVVREIVKRFTPQSIYLYNLRHSADGGVKSFKLCMIMPTGCRENTELEVYRHIDSPVPFDVMVYTPEEWEELSGREGTFASTIIRTGRLVHG